MRWRLFLGENGEGTGRAPALRSRTYNSIALAVALWRHGQEMYEKMRQGGVGWLTVEETDIGDLLAFLNMPAEHRMQPLSRNTSLPCWGCSREKATSVRALAGSA